ncbi:hypothetical protein L227DRAFT_652955 [Lentinus tigrinus ALCF2SS1-6]|uniref:BHLH domain-containing protein n=1 Tax=Lentinus tigrinus ALCF2SS1-6 TaxID=1328759 RepID=A0A5C2SBS0_9APHY|nr:hypothetical protein L227DRAFT_652955 [Lentinus tigrinus ALCF2SS1-6]
MTLFTHSESAYLTSFLSTVDLDSSISPDGSVDPSLADRVPQLQGREALAKATKDLMALDVPVSSASSSSAHHQLPAHVAGHSLPQHTGSTPSYWPSIPPAEAGTSLASATLKFGTSGVRSSSPANYLARGLSSSISPSDSSRSVPQLDRPGSSSSSIFATQLPSQPHVQIPPLRGFDLPGSSSGFTLPPISTAGFPNGAGQQGSPTRPSALPSPASAPSVLARSSTPTSTSVKRPLPNSSQSATEPSSAKRLRPSPSGTSYAPADADSTRPRRAASKSTTAAPRSVSASSATVPIPQSQTNGAGSAKGALLSPSQKRANHIQSEQKRRANIRRGYEALCETVPALREAIRAEEERERAKELEEEASAAGKKARGGADKGKKKKKGDGEKPDGRAGPRSENVVLQKTIDYIQGLLEERTALQQRLQLARGMLPLGHPALPTDPRHLDTSGVPLWEREWNGGMDLDATGAGGAAEDEGSEDEG